MASVRLFGSSYSFACANERARKGVDVREYAFHKRSYGEGMGEWDYRMLGLLLGWSNSWFLIGVGDLRKLC